VPEGVVLLLRGAGALWREPVDATIPCPEGAPPSALRTGLERVRDRRPLELGRRVAAALCSTRNQIVESERRARQAHEERLAELERGRIAAPATVRSREQSAAQRPVAASAQEVIDEAASRLERLLDDVHQGWEERIASCVGIEQLRTEVAAIENGAAHRLSLVYDELRETMTIQLVRLVLELSRPLRQELLRRRLDVAGGRSPKAEESFDDVRMVLPASIEQAFAPLRAPGVGELLSSERGFFDALVRTLAREKRDCTARLRARLDEIQRSTARELYAATVYLSPLLLTTFTGAVDELLAAHERWLEARILEERRRHDQQQARLAPALELVEPLEQREAELSGQLESWAATLAPA
jgi:hypothetical protein